MMNRFEPEYYTSRLIVDLDRLIENYRKTCEAAGQEVIPVVKGNAYGFGIREITECLVKDCGAKIIAVSRLSEALEINDICRPGTDILVLMPLREKQLEAAVANDFQFAVCSEEDAELAGREAMRQGREKARVQIKVETGLNRFGIKPGEPLEKLLDKVRTLGNLEVTGVYTHFASSDEADGPEGNAFTREQFARFKDAVSQVKAHGFSPQYVHCANTGGILWLKEAREVCTYARNISLIYGYSYMDGDWNPLGVKEVATLRCRITNLKTVGAGETVGYGRSFRAERETKLALISFGYGDGYPRDLAVKKGGKVLVGGVKCPLVFMCMDTAMVDVTGVDCKAGDEVTVFGEDGMGNEISLMKETRHLMGETVCVLLTHITDRVARVYVRNGKEYTPSSKDAETTLLTSF